MCERFQRLRSGVAPRLPFLFFGFAGLHLYFCPTYHPSVVLFAGCFGLTAYFLSVEPDAPSGRGKNFVIACLLLQGIFLALLSLNPHLLYPRSGPETAWLLLALRCAFLCCLLQIAVRLAPAFPRRQLLRKGFALAGMAYLFMALALVIFASPLPHIDVFQFSSQAADALLAGRNPYTEVYPDLYRGFYSYTPTYPYFPAILYLQAALRFLSADVRVLFLLAQGVSVAALLRASRCFRKAEGVDLALSGLWLAFPTSLFVLEQAWTDTALVVLSFCAYLAISKERWGLAGVLLGWAFAGKQYAGLFPLYGAVYVWRNGGREAGIKFSLAAAATFLVLVAPLALADWAGFWNMTIGTHLRAPFRKDSFNLVAYLFWTYGWRLPGVLHAGLAWGAVLTGLILVWPRGRNWQTGHRLAGALFVAFGCLFLTGKQAFSNYFYLTISQLLWVLLTMAPKEATPHPKNG